MKRVIFVALLLCTVLAGCAGKGGYTTGDTIVDGNGIAVTVKKVEMTRDTDKYGPLKKDRFMAVDVDVKNPNKEPLVINGLNFVAGYTNNGKEFMALQVAGLESNEDTTIQSGKTESVHLLFDLPHSPEYKIIFQSSSPSASYATVAPVVWTIKNDM